jgi:hypothetical protein
VTLLLPRHYNRTEFTCAVLTEDPLVYIDA